MESIIGFKQSHMENGRAGKASFTNLNLLEEVQWQLISLPKSSRVKSDPASFQEKHSEDEERFRLPHANSSSRKKIFLDGWRKDLENRTWLTFQRTACIQIYLP